MFDFLKSKPKPNLNLTLENLKALGNIVKARQEIYNLAVDIANVPLDRPISLARRRKLIKAVIKCENNVDNALKRVESLDK